MSTLYVTEAIAGRLFPIVDQTITFNDAQKDTIQQVRAYILAGAEQYADYSPYHVDSDTNGELQLTFDEQNKFTFTVLITYATSGFQLKYLRSTNLPYQEKNGERLIHSSYSGWTDKLIKEIQRARLLRLDAFGEPTDKNAVAYVSYEGDASFLAKYGESTENIDDYERVLRDRYIAPQTMQVVASSSQSENNGFQIVSYRCGPICLNFSPEGGKQYKVKWVWDRPVGTNGVCIVSVAEVNAAIEEKWIGKGSTCPQNKSWLDRLLKK